MESTSCTGGKNIGKKICMKELRDITAPHTISSLASQLFPSAPSLTFTIRLKDFSTEVRFEDDQTTLSLHCTSSHIMDITQMVSKLSWHDT